MFVAYFTVATWNHADRLQGRQLPEREVWAGLLPLLVLLGVATTVVVLQLRYNTRLKAIKAEQRNMQLLEARDLTERATLALRSTRQLLPRLRDSLEEASNFLAVAEAEFRDRAFGPFWDAIEQAARRLSEFSEITRSLERNGATYTESLRGRQHTFPSFPISFSQLPNAGAVVSDFRRVVRLAQRDFQFATIWEQRKTREVLIAGFRTLGDAIDNVGTLVESAITSFQTAVTRD